MKIALPSVIFLSVGCNFAAGFSSSRIVNSKTHRIGSSSLYVSIGLGPEKKEGEDKKELVAGADYEIPDHEAYRTSRRSKADEQSDVWFGALLGNEEDIGILKPLAEKTRAILLTPVELVNEVCNVICN